MDTLEGCPGIVGGWAHPSLDPMNATSTFHDSPSFDNQKCLQTLTVAENRWLEYWEITGYGQQEELNTAISHQYQVSPSAK